MPDITTYRQRFGLVNAIKLQFIFECHCIFTHVKKTLKTTKIQTFYSRFLGIKKLKFWNLDIFEIIFIFKI